jgi:hypothetical protein
MTVTAQYDAKDWLESADAKLADFDALLDQHAEQHADKVGGGRLARRHPVLALTSIGPCPA